MTGFAGLIEPEGRPVDVALGHAMARAIAHLGPDRQASWNDGTCFLTHAQLATLSEDATDRQPFTLDGVTYLVADARIDGRDDLVSALRNAGRSVNGDAPDSVLIWHAWKAWGTQCCRHLIGDFAFAIWDSARRTLFAARDQFGSVPFHYARRGASLLFGNAIQGLLADRSIDRTLDPLAIADYLLFGYGIDADRSFYRSIAHLPPAHCLTFEQGKLSIWRYWSLGEQSNDPADMLSDADAVDSFRAAFDVAVADRIRTPQVATTLSGGMDSTLIAATAKRVSDARIDAYSFGADWIVPDTERHWAWRCAQHVGLPFHSIGIEACLGASFPHGRFQMPAEPRMELMTSSFHLIADHLQAANTRVLLLGMGGDTIASGGIAHWSRLIQQRAYAALAGQAFAFWCQHRSRPPLLRALHGAREVTPPPMIALLNPEFARAHQLEERWQHGNRLNNVDPRLGMAIHPFWSELLVATHPESSGLPLRVRQPFFDVRLLGVSMRIAPTRWQFGKALLRQAGAGILPDEILQRPKVRAGVNWAWEAARRGLEPWLLEIPRLRELAPYIDLMRLTGIVGNLDAVLPQDYSRMVVIPSSLGVWLANVAKSDELAP